MQNRQFRYPREEQQPTVAYSAVTTITAEECMFIPLFKYEIPVGYVSPQGDYNTLNNKDGCSWKRPIISSAVG